MVQEFEDSAASLTHPFYCAISHDRTVDQPYEYIGCSSSQGVVESDFCEGFEMFRFKIPWLINTGLFECEAHGLCIIVKV